jgi:DNA-binding phage protein
MIPCQLQTFFRSKFRVVSQYNPTLTLESSGMEQETEKILEKIRSKRIEQKISLLNLATEAGISHSHLYYIESKRVIPSLDTIVKISKALGMGLKELIE